MPCWHVASKRAESRALSASGSIACANTSGAAATCLAAPENCLASFAEEEREAGDAGTLRSLPLMLADVGSCSGKLPAGAAPPPPRCPTAAVPAGSWAAWLSFAAASGHSRECGFCARASSHAECSNISSRRCENDTARVTLRLPVVDREPCSQVRRSVAGLESVCCMMSQVPTLAGMQRRASRTGPPAASVRTSQPLKLAVCHSRSKVCRGAMRVTTAGMT